MDIAAMMLLFALVIIIPAMNINAETKRLQKEVARLENLVNRLLNKRRGFEC